jgi:iron complex outermembrane receptor protein
MHTTKQSLIGKAGLTLCGLLLVCSARATPSAGNDDIRHLADLSIEELMNETVTSVSKREQKIGDAAAAITVLSNDDLRRSGATTVADALRLAPGLDVASVSASQPAISARGFNSFYATKLLVLVDGRSVYHPASAGVLWDLQQVMLEDVDRIEVIRGPGATMWGANAVNGVINIVTRSAKESQGGLVYGGAGSIEENLGGARYGDQLGNNSYYRVFGSYQNHGDYLKSNGQPAGDNWQTRQGGVRVDHDGQQDTHLTWQTDFTHSGYAAHTSVASNFNTLARWTQQRSARSGLEAQVYYDHTLINEANIVEASTDTYDLSLQHTLGVGAHHDVIWGACFRYIDNLFTPNNPYVRVRKGKTDEQIYSAFVQDEYRLLQDRLSLTAGVKLEHNPFSGLEVQPNVRAAFKPTARATLWAAISRAVRTPTILEARDTLAVPVAAPLPGPGGGLYLPAVVGNPTIQSEVVRAYELGYRMQVNDRISMDAATFYNDYDKLIYANITPTFVPGTPFGTAEFPFANAAKGQTYGGELTATFMPADAWRLTAGYSLLHAIVSGRSIIDPQELARSAPQHQVSLRSSYDFASHVSLDVQARYVGAILEVPAYTTADIHLAYQLTQALELALVGQNLLQHQHAEQANNPLYVADEVPRGYYAKFTWRF